MRMPEPFFKKSHKCWYVEIDGKQKRLDSDEDKAWKLYHKMMAGQRVVGEDNQVLNVMEQFLDWSEHHWP